jgi:hypothetical protein
LQANAQTDALRSDEGSDRKQRKYEAQNYIDANFGFALVEIDENVPFPGASILFGRRSFIAQKTFFDFQLGFAFPTIATAKIGIGELDPVTGKSWAVGIRPWPAHFYLQFGKEDSRCGDDIKPRIARRLKRRGKDSSDILCGETIFSFELGTNDESSAYSAFMITYSQRWYLN